MELKALIQARDKAAAEVAAARERIDVLERKRADLDEDDAVPAAEAKKRWALSRFILGDAPKEEVDNAKVDFEQAQRKKEETAELIEAIEEAIEEIRRQLPALQRAAETASVSVWRGIAEELKEKARKASGDLIAMAYVAEPYVGPFEIWLGHLFKEAGQATHGDNAFAVRKRVEEEYLGR